MAPRRDDQPDTRGLGLGIELTASIVGFALVGLWVDHAYDSSPWGILICLAIGLVGGFYNFLRASIRILRSPATRTARSNRSQQSAARRSSDGRSPDTPNPTPPRSPEHDVDR